MSKLKFETVEEAVKHIEEIQSAHKSEVAELKEKNKTALDDQKKKSADAGSAKDDQVAALQDQVKDLTDKLSAAEQERDEANTALNGALGEVGSLSEQLELREKNGGATIVRVGKKDYALNGKRFNVPGHGILSVEELSKNDKALAYLVEKKSGMLVEAKGSK